jgi:hypothetical protein
MSCQMRSSVTQSATYRRPLSDITAWLELGGVDIDKRRSLGLTCLLINPGELRRAFIQCFLIPFEIELNWCSLFPGWLIAIPIPY